MADQTGSLMCPICSEAYTATAEPHDRRPTVFCKNSHTLCSTCASSLDKCPTCNEPKVHVPNEDVIHKRVKLAQNDDTGTATAVDTAAAAATTSSSSADADVYAEFDVQLCALDQSVKDYKLNDARSQIEACQHLLTRFDRTAATASTTRFHSVKGYMHHWFDEHIDAYAETYQALTELHELCTSGSSFESELVVKVLCYAVRCIALQKYNIPAAELGSYAVRYAKSKSSTAAYADALETFYSVFDSTVISDSLKMAKFVRNSRLDTVPYKTTNASVAAAYYFEAEINYRQQYTVGSNFDRARRIVDTALDNINTVDENNILAALCKSLKGKLIFEDEDEKEKAESLDNSRKLEMDALQIAERILGKNNRTVSIIYECLAKIARLEGKYEEAESMYNEAIKSAENSLGPNSLRAAELMDLLGRLCDKKLKKAEEAKRLLGRASQIQKGGDWEPKFENKLPKAKNENVLKSKYYNAVSKTFESGDEAVEALEELAGVLRNFFNVAPKPQPV